MIPGSRPFRCPICLQRFRTSGHRKAHYNLHFRDSSASQATQPVQFVDTNEEQEEVMVQSDVDVESSVLVTVEPEPTTGQELEVRLVLHVKEMSRGNWMFQK